MLTAILQSGEQVIAWEVSRNQSPFKCPECGGEVVLKAGKVVTHHFAHKVSSNCEYGSGESVEHLRIKRELYEFLLQNPNCSNWAMERYIWEGAVRPDLSGRINNKPLVIEVQRSNTTHEVIKHRFDHYSKHGVAMLWVLTDFPPCNQWKWELYEIYGKQLYVYDRALEVVVYMGRQDGYVSRLGKANIISDFTHRKGVVCREIKHPLIYSLRFESYKRMAWEYQIKTLEKEIESTIRNLKSLLNPGRKYAEKYRAINAIDAPLNWKLFWQSKLATAFEEVNRPENIQF